MLENFVRIVLHSDIVTCLSCNDAHVPACVVSNREKLLGVN